MTSNFEETLANSFSNKTGKFTRQIIPEHKVHSILKVRKMSFFSLCLSIVHFLYAFKKVRVDFLPMGKEHSLCIASPTYIE